jgi:hypothetical protein
MRVSGSEKTTTEALLPLSWRRQHWELKDDVAGSKDEVVSGLAEQTEKSKHKTSHDQEMMTSNCMTSEVREFEVCEGPFYLRKNIAKVIEIRVSEHFWRRAKKVIWRKEFSSDLIIQEKSHH